MPATASCGSPSREQGVDSKDPTLNVCHAALDKGWRSLGLRLPGAIDDGVERATMDLGAAVTQTTTVGVVG